MSTTLVDLFTDCAHDFSDPEFTLMTRQNWLVAYNAASRELCTDINVIEYDATFDIAIEDTYPYPDDLVSIIGVAYNPDVATDDRAFRWLDPKHRDEFIQRTNGKYPDGAPDSYYPRRGFFMLVPRPDVAVEAGGLLSYYGLPPNETDFTTGMVAVPDKARDFLRELMVVMAMRKNNRWSEAREAYAAWKERLPEVKTRLESAGTDRRKNLRPRGINSPVRNLV